MLTLPEAILPVLPSFRHAVSQPDLAGKPKSCWSARYWPRANAPWLRPSASWAAATSATTPAHTDKQRKIRFPVSLC